MDHRYINNLLLYKLQQHFGQISSQDKGKQVASIVMTTKLENGSVEVMEIEILTNVCFH